ERRELLEQADRVRSAQDRDRAGEANVCGACGRCGQDDWWGRVEELAAMVLADAEHIQADLVGALDALEQFAQSCGRTGGEAGVVEGGGETIDSDLHLKAS